MEYKNVRKQVTIENLEPDMKILESITSFDERVLILKGTVLDEKIIKKIIQQILGDKDIKSYDMLS